MSEETDEILTGFKCSPKQQSFERAIGAQVRELRRSADLSIADLAAAADMSPGMLSKIENGQISPSLSTASGVGHGAERAASPIFSRPSRKNAGLFLCQGRAGGGDRTARHQGRSCLSAARTRWAGMWCWSRI